ncbi:MAG: peptidoglycan-binding domain-containing protein [Clostridiales bacterium]|nr:peptidoglycan-binding domain-containing protein [Clostridiales bacterium]
MKNRKAARILSILLCLAMLLTLPVSAESVDGTYAELKYGMRDNDDVRAMQTRLRELGYMSAYPSGGYFDDTAKAVADFQAASGLKTDKRTASSEMLALLFSDEAIAKNGAVTPADTPAPAPTTAPATDSPSQTDAPAPAYSKLTYGTRSSSAVRAMQDRLRELGYMTCDSTGGYWGETAKAVADFQAAAGLKVDKNTASAEMQQLLFSDKAPAKGGNTPAPTEPDAPVEPTTAPSAYTELRANTSSEAIRAMQARLKALGYLMANPSGGYYSATISAVEAFQRAAGLKVQGKVATVEMQQLLFSSSAPSAYAGAAEYADLSYGTSDSDQVRLMQRRLSNLGYFSGTATGNYYSATQRAVSAFMTAIGLSGNGKTATAAMLKILYSAGAPAKGEIYNPDPTAAPTATPAPDETTPAPSQEPTPTPVPVVYGELKYGVRGNEAVRSMQDRLRALGYMSCASTGGYFTQTRRAIQAFLEACYMSGDGRTATVEMQQLLFSDRAPQYGDKLITTSPSPDVTPDPTASVEPTAEPTLAPADSYTALTYGMSKSDAVLAAQARLRELGYMSCAPTGNYYSLTVAAVKAFQKYAYLPVDGKTISPEMQQILFYTGDLAKLIEERKNAQSDYSKARTDITMKIGATGEQVVYMTRRLKELGYLTGSETDIYSSSVAEAVRWFQNSNGLDADGIAGPATLKKLYSDNVIDANGSMTGNDDKPVKVDGTPVKPALSAVKSVDFFSSEGDKYFNRKKGTFRDGAYAIVTDVATGISYRVKRVGGYNHTDVEPATAFDTWQMYRIYGEEWAWTRHAVLVTLSDGTTLAGSANGMPHGESHISGNNMNGHTCIHFLNSRTHGSDKVDAAHQSAIRAAANCSVSSVQAKVNAQ